MSTEEKITALESRVRRQQFALAGLGAGLALSLFLGMTQQAPKNMTLENLTINHDGKPRIVMGTNEENGDVGFALLDANGVARIAMGFEANKNDPGIAIMDSKEQARIAMGQSQAGAGIMLIGAGLTEIPIPAQPDKN
ncbi:MAG: hypothetical protein P8L37_04430 [Phycisphaerales bacterium]|nr:hypothetical protein [Phycisphaerales bacterium]